MFIFGKLVNCAGSATASVDTGCGISPETHQTTKNDIIQPYQNKANKLSIKASSYSNINELSCTVLCCDHYWHASTSEAAQPWIQYEYATSKAQVSRYYIGDMKPACTNVTWTLSGSNDNSTFYTIDKRTDGMNKNSITPVNVNNQYYYRYLRLTFTDAPSCDRVSLGFFTMEGDLKKWGNEKCTPFGSYYGLKFIGSVIVLVI